MLAGCILTGFTSGRNDDEPKYEEGIPDSIAATPLGNILSDIFESADSQKDYYRVFDLGVFSAFC